MDAPLPLIIVTGKGKNIIKNMHIEKFFLLLHLYSHLPYYDQSTDPMRTIFKLTMFATPKTSYNLE